MNVNNFERVLVGVINIVFTLISITKPGFYYSEEYKSTLTYSFFKRSLEKGRRTENKASRFSFLFYI